MFLWSSGLWRISAYCSQSRVRLVLGILARTYNFRWIYSDLWMFLWSSRWSLCVIRYIRADMHSPRDSPLDLQDSSSHSRDTDRSSGESSGGSASRKGGSCNCAVKFWNNIHCHVYDGKVIIISNIERDIEVALFSAVRTISFAKWLCLVRFIG